MLRSILHLSSGGISRRMVRTLKGTYPVTDFVGREQAYDDEKFVAAPVKKGNLLVSLNLSGQTDWRNSIYDV